MFDIGWTELLIVGAIALIVIGPKELPGVLRMLGQWMAKIRRMASDFQGQFHEAMREAEMADLKKQVDELSDTARDFTSEFDPVGSIEDALDDPFDDKPGPARKTKADDKTVAADAEADSPPEAIEAAPAGEEKSSPSPADEAKAETDDRPPPPKAAAGGHPA